MGPWGSKTRVTFKF